jgi:hypothetical protein
LLDWYFNSLESRNPEVRVHSCIGRRLGCV